MPLGKELKIVECVTSEGNRYFEGTEEIILPNGEIAVSAEGKYMKVNIERITTVSEIDDDWFLLIVRMILQKLRYHEAS